MFGKLFCYLAIVKSGVISSNIEASLNILNRIIELHNRKGWIREVCIEALLLFCYSSSRSVMEHVVVKLAPLLTGPLAEMSAWQLMLLLGLTQACTHVEVESFTEEMLRTSVTKESMSLSKLNEVSETLLACTSGFPKMHRVWDYLLACIFPMNTERQLSGKRLNSFTAQQVINIYFLYT